MSAGSPCHSQPTSPEIPSPVFVPLPAKSQCLSLAQIQSAPPVTGKVLRVKQGNRGVHFFDFCEDYRMCPFTVVVFPSNLKHVGDVRQLEGKDIQIHGPIKEYDGRAEIILERTSQLDGEAC